MPRVPSSRRAATSASGLLSSTVQRKTLSMRFPDGYHQSIDETLCNSSALAIWLKPAKAA
eukprot:1577453-Amphidinium_carterae.1